MTMVGLTLRLPDELHEKLRWLAFKCTTAGTTTARSWPAKRPAGNRTMNHFIRTTGRMALRFSLALSVGLAAALQADAATYIVAPTGDNRAGDGSADRPWATLSHAATKAVSGDTIRLSQGTFVENTYIDIPPGVGVEGAGTEQTILRCTQEHREDGALHPDKFALRLRSDSWQESAQRLSGFTLDGNERKLHGGIVVEKRRNVTVSEVRFRNIMWAGLFLSECDKGLVDGCAFEECAWESTGYSSGALVLGAVDGIEVRNSTIRAMQAGTGYGIKALRTGGKPSWKSVVVHDCRIELKETAAWAGGAAPNISIEAATDIAAVERCEIHHCTINTNISFPGLARGAPEPTGPTVRIHHNYLPLKDGYTVELSLSNSEIDHNYADGGRWFVSGFYCATKNVRIHHNVIRNVPSVSDVSPFIIGKTDSLYVYNNTFVIDKGYPSPGLVIVQDTCHMVFQNNLLLLYDGIVVNDKVIVRLINPGRSTGRFKSLTVANNVFSKIIIDSAAYPGTYNTNIVGKGQITASGDRPVPYYIPAGSSSNLVDAGSAQGLAGIEYLGKAPDIGACEWGAAAERPDATKDKPGASPPGQQ